MLYVETLILNVIAGLAVYGFVTYKIFIKIEKRK